jgi:hypothetical protein
MDIFVKYTDSDTLHHFRTGDGEGSDPASFRASVFNGRRDVQMFDADGAELDVVTPDAPAVEEVVAPTTRKRKVAAVVEEVVVPVVEEVVVPVEEAPVE